MKERGRFLYQNEEGIIYISFERGGTGVPIESVIPENGRGESFVDFKIQDYFDLADLVLAAPKDWAKFCKTVDIKGATKDNPKKVSPPPPNLDFLKLRSAKGMDAERTAELFCIVTAYWQSNKDLGLEPGLVATLWHSGMKADDIITHVRRFTNSNGKLELGAFKDERGYQILNTMLETYKEAKGLDAVLLQTEMSTLFKTWLASTREAKPGSIEMTNTVLHWSDYRRLGLIDAAGAVIMHNVRKLAKFVFATDAVPDFEMVEQWASIHLVKSTDMPSTSTNAAKALMKKKRKQGRVNRKRGRR